MNSKVSLQIAKENVIKYYPVVGVLEKFNQTLTVLENIMPQYFAKATSAFYHDKSFKIDTYANEHKKQVDEVIKSIVRRNLTNEIEFYEFCCQRLQNQFKELMNVNELN